MGDFSIGVLTGAGSTTLPIISLYGGGTTTALPRIFEIGVSNTSTTTAVALKLVRLTATGTQGAGLTEAILNSSNPEVPTASGFTTHTVTAANTDLGYRCVLGPLSGWVWTWEDYQLVIPANAVAGIGIMVENGTGQACQAYIAWRE